MTGFPTLKHLNLGRAVDVTGLDTSRVASGAKNMADSASNTVNTAQNQANQVGDHLQNISDDLKIRLPAYYKVGLLGYCEGKTEMAGYSNCSDPSTSFSFDLLHILSSASSEVDQLFPSGNGKILAGYHDLSVWSTWAYIWGLIATVFAIIFGTTSIIFSFGKKLLIILSVVCSTSGILCEVMLTAI